MRVGIHDGITILIRKGRERPLSPCEHPVSEKVAIHKPGREPSSRTESARNLDLGPPSPQNWEKARSVVQAAGSVVFSYGSQSRPTSSTPLNPPRS